MPYQDTNSNDANLVELQTELSRASDWLVNLNFEDAYSLYKNIEIESQEIGRTTEYIYAGRYAAIANIQIGKSEESIQHLDILHQTYTGNLMAGCQSPKLSDIHKLLERDLIRIQSPAGMP